ncbi:hypothetical protein ACVDFE_11180 [Lentzea chajnantorensis]
MTRQRLDVTELPEVSELPAGYELVTWTGRVPAHRGKGLGRLMKTRMMRELTGIEVVLTRTSSQNEHMLRVNHALGYRDQFVYLAVQAKIADLAA